MVANQLLFSSVHELNSSHHSDLTAVFLGLEFGGKRYPKIKERTSPFKLFQGSFQHNSNSFQVTAWPPLIKVTIRRTVSTKQRLIGYEFIRWHKLFLKAFTIELELDTAKVNCQILLNGTPVICGLTILAENSKSQLVSFDIALGCCWMRDWCRETVKATRRIQERIIICLLKELSMWSADDWI